MSNTPHDDREICPRCGCCEMCPEECPNCGGDGVAGHECGEDCCCCQYPEDNVRCDICGGKGYFMICLGRCDADGKHKPDGAERRGLPSPEDLDAVAREEEIREKTS